MRGGQVFSVALLIQSQKFTHPSIPRYLTVVKASFKVGLKWG
jgi:hypothetical protein